MLMESYIWFIVRPRFADEYHLYRRQERDGEGGFIRSASGYYRSVINIVPLAAARRGIMVTLSLLSRGGRIPESCLKPSRKFLLTTWRFNAVNRVMWCVKCEIANCGLQGFRRFFFFSVQVFPVRSHRMQGKFGTKEYKIVEKICLEG